MLLRHHCAYTAITMLKTFQGKPHVFQRHVDVAVFFIIELILRRKRASFDSNSSIIR